MTYEPAWVQWEKLYIATQNTAIIEQRIKDVGESAGLSESFTETMLDLLFAELARRNGDST